MWGGGGLVVGLIGLFMFLHERTSHDTCAAISRGLRTGFVQVGLNCGFSDTVYWAGIVICVAGFVSLIAIAGSAISVAAKARARNRRPQGRLKSRNALRHIDPTDPVTRWRLDPATDWRPGPAGWHAGPNVAVPFVPPVRDVEETDISPSPGKITAAGDITITSRNGVVLLEQSPAPVADLVASERRAPLPTPAWYPDPDNPDAIRWWDGESWGESLANGR
jgi:hypothetical protein